MPYSMRRPCSELSCPELSVPGSAYCAEHKIQKDAEFKARSREYDQGRNQYAIYDAEWRKFRKKYLREHPYCDECGGPAELIDHIKPLSQGGEKYDPKNLAPKCWRCHSRKTAKRDGGYRGRGR